MGEFRRRLNALIDEGPAAGSEDNAAPVVAQATDNAAHHHHEKTVAERMDTWATVREMSLFNTAYNVVAVVLAVVIIGVMLATVTQLPSFGDPGNPANNEVPRKYIEDGMSDTGAVNVVAGMILDYRAFDTFGESTVLFIAAAAVIILLRTDRKKKGKHEDEALYEPEGDKILQLVSGILVPVALMFGLYVVLNGHLSAGGGFSGGAIMGGAFILFYNAYGHKAAGKFFTYKTFNKVTIGALGVYAISKSYSFYTGANQIHSIIPNGVPGDLISSGLILVLNICVGIIVACTMFGFYSLFSREAI